MSSDRGRGRRRGGALVRASGDEDQRRQRGVTAARCPDLGAILDGEGLDDESTNSIRFSSQL